MGSSGPSQTAITNDLEANGLVKTVIPITNPNPNINHLPGKALVRHT